MREIENLKKHILEEYPRLTEKDTFSFKCHPDVSCFNKCCGDVNIFLTPYDILRLKNVLGISSGEFLKKHTISPFDKNLKYPVILLKMGEDDDKKCPFVTPQGCSVYGDRPWACRMYPLGLASPKSDSQELDEAFYFLLQESICKGLDEDHQYSVASWLEDQGIQEYNAAGEGFKELTLHPAIQQQQGMSPQKMEMFFTACYDLDKFRDFLFSSSFFDRFEVDEETRKCIRKDDEALLAFAYRWIRFALLGEKTLTIKPEVMEAHEKKATKPQSP